MDEVGCVININGYRIQSPVCLVTATKTLKFTIYRFAMLTSSGVLLWCGGPVSSSSTVIAQTPPKNCVGESPRVIVKWYLALVTLPIGIRYVTL